MRYVTGLHYAGEQEDAKPRGPFSARDAVSDLSLMIEGEYEDESDLAAEMEDEDDRKARERGLDDDMNRAAIALSLLGDDLGQGAEIKAFGRRFYARPA